MYEKINNEHIWPISSIMNHINTFLIFIRCGSFFSTHVLLYYSCYAWLIELLLFMGIILCQYPSTCDIKYVFFLGMYSCDFLNCSRLSFAVCGSGLAFQDWMQVRFWIVTCCVDCGWGGNFSLMPFVIFSFSNNVKEENHTKSNLKNI